MSGRRVLSSERTLKECRKLGLTAGKVERFVSRAGQYGRRFDLWGWVDIVAIGDGYVIAIQSCAMSGRSKHLAKFAADQGILTSLERWLAVPGCRAELWAWRKRKVKRGGVAVRWAVERSDLTELLEQEKLELQIGEGTAADTLAEEVGL